MINARLLIISDLTEIESQHVQILKRVLGRDTISSESKHLNGIEPIEPYCQVLIVSNERPEHFPLLANDRGIMDKLIQVHLGDQCKIPNDKRIPNIGSMLTLIIAEVFNWVIYAPKDLLQYYIRADEIARTIRDR